MLDYNIHFRWFLDMDLDGRPFEHSVFSKNRDRLMEQEIAHRLLQEVVRLARNENRNGLYIDIAVSTATGTAERECALDLIKRERRRGGQRVKAVGADKGYFASDFALGLRRFNVRPHIAVRANKTVAGLDGRTTRHEGYEISRRKRKRVEEIFGWLKSIAGMRKTRVKGVTINQTIACITAAGYNPIRMTKLMPLAEGVA